MLRSPISCRFWPRAINKDAADPQNHCIFDSRTRWQNKIQKFQMYQNYWRSHVMRKCRYSKTCVKLPLSKKKKRNLFKTNYHLLQVKIGAFCILTTIIKLPFVIEIFFFVYFWFAILHRFYCSVFLLCQGETTHLEFSMFFIVQISAPKLYKNTLDCKQNTMEWGERSGSVVECLTRDQRVAGSNLNGVTLL